jgi:DNA-binding XRE family transcriptional regulator
MFDKMSELAYDALGMKKRLRKRLEAVGGRVTTVQEYLDLSDADMAVIEMKIALAKALRLRRKSADLTQLEAAKLVGSSQSRVAKMEAGDPSVSLDLLVGSMLKLGASRAQVGQALGRAPRSAPRAGRRNDVSARPRASLRRA